MDLYCYNAVITNVVDGDTFDVDLDLGFHLHNHIRIRLLGIDTPEKRGNEEKELGIICTNVAKYHFLGRKVIIKTVETDSFGRWLANLYYNDGVDCDIIDCYNNLGINKLSDTYDIEKIKSYEKEDIYASQAYTNYLAEEVKYQCH